MIYSGQVVRQFCRPYPFPYNLSSQPHYQKNLCTIVAYGWIRFHTRVTSICCLSSSHSITATTANPSDAENGGVEREDDDDDDRKKENQTNKKIYERCNNYNIVKHVVSIVFIVFDVVFDWIEYVEMNNRGNISVEIPTEQTPKYTVKKWVAVFSQLF